MGHPDNKWKALSIKINNDFMTFETLINIEDISVRHDKIEEYFKLYWIWFIFASLIPFREEALKQTLAQCMSFLDSNPVIKKDIFEKEVSIEIVRI